MTIAIDEHAEKVSPPLSRLIRGVAGEAFSPDEFARMSGMVLDAGRAKAPRVAKEKKAVPMSAPEAMKGGDKFIRPNGDIYYTRKWGEHDDIQVLRTAREKKQYVFLYGAPGCGKTAAIEAAFHDQPGGFFTVLGSGDTEVSDLIGGYVQTPSGSFLWEDGPLVKAAESGGVLLMDEIGLIDPKVLSVAYGLMDGRQEYTVTANPERGTVKAQPGFFVLGATNPNAPGVRLSEALLSRFAVHTEWSTDWGLARKLGAPTAVVTAAQNLAKKQQSSEVSWAPQMRELLAFRDVADTFGTKFAISNLLAAAPEIDRPVVADVLSRVFGEPCLPAKV